MSAKQIDAESCSVIDEFIGQGVAASGEPAPTGTGVTPGCTTITEFVGQGQTVREMPQSTIRPEQVQSAGQGCETITTITDQGFLPGSDKGAGKGEVQPTPRVSA